MSDDGSVLQSGGPFLPVVSTCRGLVRAPVCSTLRRGNLQQIRIKMKIKFKKKGEGSKMRVGIRKIKVKIK